MKSVFYYDTPIGRLGLAENGRAVTDVLLHGERPADAEIRETPLLQKAAEQLAEYFGGLRTEFELPLEFEIGTPFERTVWQALSTIPYGCLLYTSLPKRPWPTQRTTGTTSSSSTRRAACMWTGT